MLMYHSLRTLHLAVALGVAMTTWGCSTAGAIVGSVVTATIVGARSPTTEIEQIYYLGVFDPEDQLPSSLYRVRVHGQASALSATKFASGWVRSELVDSLNTQIGFDEKTGRVTMHKSDADKVSLLSNRRQVLFGPEGFREAPADHRLVIVMGQSPEQFFQAVDQALGVVALAERTQREGASMGAILEDLADLRLERLQLLEFKSSLPEGVL